MRHCGERFRPWAGRLADAGLALPRSADGWPLPLVIGARELVLERFAGTMPPERLARLLGTWVRATAYQTALARAGAWRHDLAGRPVQPVSCEHRRRARAELESRRRARAEAAA